MAKWLPAGFAFLLAIILGVLWLNAGNLALYSWLPTPVLVVMEMGCLDKITGMVALLGTLMALRAGFQRRRTVEASEWESA